MSIEIYRRALEQIKKNKGGVIVTVIESVSYPYLPGYKFWWDEEMEEETHNLLPGTGGKVDLLCRQVWRDKLPQVKRIQLQEGGFIELFAQPYFPGNSLVILGGGHISAALAPMALDLGFFISVVDDRPEFANNSRFPRCNVICRDFPRAFNEISINQNTYILIVTRGHRHDLLCLENALGTTARYIGMIGSKKKVKMIKEHLLEKGFSEKDWERVYAPVGLPIGAKTPAEIAVSILAEVVAVKYGKREKMEASTI